MVVERTECGSVGWETTLVLDGWEGTRRLGLDLKWSNAAESRAATAGVRVQSCGSPRESPKSLEFEPRYFCCYGVLKELPWFGGYPIVA